MATSEMLYTYIPFIGKRRNDDGTLMVTGKAAGPDLDNDGQVCNEKWLASALPEWFETGANVREQHSKVAAGVGKVLEHTGGGSWRLDTLVVDPVSVQKCEEQVLNGYSVGIKGGRVIKSDRAPNGEIVGGRIVEVSLVDRGSNPTCKIDIVKADVADDNEWELVDVDKANYRGTGGMPPLDGDDPEDARYPIKNAKDLKDAMKALGRVKEGDRAKVIAHIKQRAKALKLTSMLNPDIYKAFEAALDKWATADINKADELPLIEAALQAISQLIVCEAEELANGEDEYCDLSNLLSAVCALWCFWQHEASTGEVPAPPNEQDGLMDLSLTAVADLMKSASADTATDEDKAAAAEIRKAVLGDGEFISKADHEATVATAVEAAVEPLQTRLAEVEKMAAPGGPTLRQPPAEANRASAREMAIVEAENLEKMANTVSDRQTAAGYRERATKARERADALLTK